jgi:ATP-dependent Lon protease
VLPIGGLKEKLLAALRGGITNVLIPKDNEKDLADVPGDVKRQLAIHPVQWIDQVFELALTATPITAAPPVAGQEVAGAPKESYIAH